MDHRDKSGEKLFFLIDSQAHASSKVTGGGHSMSSTSHCIPASVDLSKIPRDYDGLWVVVQRSDQAILGSGQTSKQAMDASGRAVTDMTIVVARVPVEANVFVARPR